MAFEATVTITRKQHIETNNRVSELIGAARALYGAGNWTCDKGCDEARLWQNLRYAVDRREGVSLKPLEAK